MNQLRTADISGTVPLGRRPNDACGVSGSLIHVEEI